MLIIKQLWTQQEKEKTQVLLQACGEGWADLHVCTHEQMSTVYNSILLRQQTDSVAAPQKPDCIFQWHVASIITFKHCHFSVFAWFFFWFFLLHWLFFLIKNCMNFIYYFTTATIYIKQLKQFGGHWGSNHSSSTHYHFSYGRTEEEITCLPHTIILLMGEWRKKSLVFHTIIISS